MSAAKRFLGHSLAILTSCAVLLAPSQSPAGVLFQESFEPGFTLSECSSQGPGSWAVDTTFSHSIQRRLALGQSKAHS